MNFKAVNSVAQISSDDWQRLNKSSSLFLNPLFLNALENSQSVSTQQGWQPQHLLISDEQRVNAIIPAYIKQHSWGEFVFDWDWARAYEEHDLPYYPKLVCAIPFTPISSEKHLSNDMQQHEVFQYLTEHCQANKLHSCHMLFCQEAPDLPPDVYHRHTVQFHWFNRSYRNFDHFLSTFNSRKRKNTRKERDSITQQDITIEHLSGQQIDEQQLDFFYQTYQLTYFKRGHTPHLAKSFFKEIFASMPSNVLLMIASRLDKPIACALFFVDSDQLYGRYWGCIEPIKNLHFELCYYQGIDYCIANNIARFNPGPQGEHKIQRGFEPILTHSYHWISHQAFKGPIKDFCAQERLQMHHYQQQCALALPFKQL